MKKLLLPALLFVSACAIAQDTAQLKRVPYKLTVAVDKNSAYLEDIKATPYILPDNTIQLYPGETIYVEVDLENGIIKHMTAVKAIRDAAKTLTISFSQTAKKKVHELMMLKIENPFPFKLTYRAQIYPLQHGGWVSTDVLPVMAGISGFETWQNVITSIALSGWAFESK